MVVVQAVPLSLPPTRHLVADWPTPAAEDIVLAVSEAVANVIDNAYPDRAEIGL
jgi:hypothetical protein